MEFNTIVENLKPYPMEELKLIKKDLISQNKKVLDFGTGDPKIPTSPFIRNAVLNHIPEISQYPSIRGEKALIESIWAYLGDRFSIKKDDRLDILPSNGSKEAIFHTALCVVGRKNRRTIVYPNPGYPVYRAGAIFANGTPVPVSLDRKSGYLLQPWDLPDSIQNETAAIWINYPHNPTGAIGNDTYYSRLVEWAEKYDVLILSDECYVDIFSPESTPPMTLSSYGSERVISFMSLSKRSGITGYRSGCIIGAKPVIAKLARARANFGAGTPTFIQHAAAAAWTDKDHVQMRRAIFQERMNTLGPFLISHGLIDESPKASFYFWCKIPPKWNGDDIEFSKELARMGIITTPSQWLSEGIRGFVRFAMVPELNDIKEAISILEQVLTQ